MQLARVWVPLVTRSQVQRSRQTSLKSPYWTTSTAVFGAAGGPTSGAGPRPR
jgi:hypothetical protein